MTYRLERKRMVIPASPLPEQMRNRAVEILNFCLCVAFVLGYLAAGILVAVGPARLHESNSMKIVAGLGLSWPAWGVIAGAVAVLLISGKTRVLGYFAGAVLIGFYFVSYVLSIKHGNAGSAFGLLAGYIAVLSQFSGGVRSMIVAEWAR